MSKTFTIVSFHAHPDDESLLTGGTLARASAEGHRVVVVVATAGEAGLAADTRGRRDLGVTRLEELRASARALGTARVEVLGYADSGSEVVSPGHGGPGGGEPRFCELDPEEPAQALARILVEEKADVLTSYDPQGGYGHPDHVQVHRVAARAAELAGTPVLLEATFDRTSMRRLGRVLHAASKLLPMPQLWDFSSSGTARDEITHVVDVSPYLPAKRASLRAHASQTTGGRGPRTIGLLSALPRPLDRLFLGREWFREVGRTPDDEPLDDIFATLGERAAVAAG
jgi:LmbE family N-acetylglucosaminyl deacetylase